MIKGRILGPAAKEAWTNSLLATQFGADADDLLLDSSEVDAVPGEVVHRVDESRQAVLFVVAGGLLRVYTRSPQGRQVTVRYLSASDVFGLPTVLAPSVLGEGQKLAVQALTDAKLLRLSPQRFRAVFEAHPEHNEAVYAALTRALLDAYELLVENVFLTVRQRIGRHILDLAQRTDGQLVIAATQQEIADAIGSVREVVSRGILRLRKEGVLERVEDGYVIVDAARLHEIASEPA